MHNAISQLNTTLTTLKDFQRATVKSVIENYAKAEHSNRVLVADEVGLGKTIVAKGIIAELLKKRIQDKNNNKILRVTYICSNLTLANENKKKLAVFYGEDQKKFVAEPSFARLVHLAVKNKEYKVHKNTLLEVNSLTPSTSFNLTSGHGNKWERIIIYKMVLHCLDMTAYKSNLSKFFRSDVKGWKSLEQNFDDNYIINNAIQKDFLEVLQEQLSSSQLMYIGAKEGSFNSILTQYFNDKNTINKEVRLRTLLRVALAKSCARNLEADLFILDEFQRFQSLLDTNTENDESLIAREIFKKTDHTKILLLSATPFKAISRLDEDEQKEAHIDELRRLLRFLSNKDEDFIKKYETQRGNLLNQILSLKDKEINLTNIHTGYKEAIEDLLSSFICRTERAQISIGFDNVFESKIIECQNTFSHDEISSFIAIDQLGQALNSINSGRYSSQLMEYYKSVPWALSFLSGYQFKRVLEKYKKDSSVKKSLKASKKGWLSKKDIENYRLNVAKYSPNAKLKSLIDMFFDDGGEELLWIPPTMPYYNHSGSFVDKNTFTKSILFSSWALVPRALSGLISYEAERRIMSKRTRRNYFDFNKNHNPRLRFEGHVSLDIWGLVYPSKVLSQMSFNNIGSYDINKLLEERTKYFQKKLSNLKNAHYEGDQTNYWFALAPMILDISNGDEQYVDSWINNEKNKASAKNQDGRYTHLLKLENELEKFRGIEYIPIEYSEYLAKLSIGSPAVCFARMSNKYWEKDKEYFTYLSEMSIGLISMFNKAESEVLLKKKYDDDKYWKKVLNYCIEGNFQAMIDEYAHLLSSSGYTLSQASARFYEVLSFSTSTVSCQFEEYKHLNKKNSEKKHSRLRCHYAVPLGTQKLAEAQGIQRVGHVRDAFNSPFRPFVLNSTSIGQEGLDFHWYCSRVIHWNLPSNPIDIEQREGRVNRYKSLVVRRRVCEIYTMESNTSKEDLWDMLFKHADLATKDHRESDLVPYWHLKEGQAKIERIVPMMPMSKEVIRLKESLKILSLYRLAFGQPRQEELLSNLLERDMSPEDIKIMTDALVINLAPLMHLSS